MWLVQATTHRHGDQPTHDASESDVQDFLMHNLLQAYIYEHEDSSSLSNGSTIEWVSITYPDFDTRHIMNQPTKSITGFKAINHRHSANYNR